MISTDPLPARTWDDRHAEVRAEGRAQLRRLRVGVAVDLGHRGARRLDRLRRRAEGVLVRGELDHVGEAQLALHLADGLARLEPVEPLEVRGEGEPRGLRRAHRRPPRRARRGARPGTPRRGLSPARRGAAGAPAARARLGRLGPAPRARGARPAGAGALAEGRAGLRCGRRRGGRRVRAPWPERGRPRPRSSPAISAGVSARNCPGSRPFAVTGPKDTRRSFETGCPTASSSRFTSCCLPSWSATSTQALFSASMTRARSTAMKSPSTRTPALQPLERLRVGHPVHLGVVDARHLVARVRDALREGAVVGQQDEALGGHVEPADREEPGDRGHEVHDRRPALGVLARGDDAAGLVEDQVDGRLRRLDPDAVHAHVVRVEVGLRPELAHVLAVDRDPALEHQLLGPAPRGEAGPGEDLLESLFHGGIFLPGVCATPPDPAHSGEWTPSVSE